MTKKENNFAFVDSQNINLGVKRLGWQMSWKKLRTHLAHKYRVTRAYMFLGYIPENQKLYSSLQRAGFVLIFKTVVKLPGGRHKGNVDAELVLQAMIDIEEYDGAVIMTSDGDFSCLVNHLREESKLRAVLSPERANCSKLLESAAKSRMEYLDSLRGKLEY